MWKNPSTESEKKREFYLYMFSHNIVSGPATIHFLGPALGEGILVWYDWVAVTILLPRWPILMLMIWILIEAFTFIWGGVAGRSPGLFSIKLCVRWTILLLPWDHLRDNTVYSLTIRKKIRDNRWKTTESVEVFSAWHVETDLHDDDVSSAMQLQSNKNVVNTLKVIMFNENVAHLKTLRHLMSITLNVKFSSEMCRSVLLNCCGVSWNNFILLF